MSKQNCPPIAAKNTATHLQSTVGNNESDEDFLMRQFRQSIEALERVHALSSGEFDQLIQVPVHTEEDFKRRANHHEEIARHAFQAAQKGLLSEEEFNIWSGRRKEDGQPVKFRFERAYSNASTPLISCMRGALTGIVRAYVRLQDETIAALIQQAGEATSAEDLLRIEKEAVRLGLLEFEPYNCGEYVAGWPSFPRSTGRFRGATRLRQYLEQRQSEIPMPAELTEQVRQMLFHAYDMSTPTESPLKESAREYQVTPATEAHPAPLKKILASITKIFH